MRIQAHVQWLLVITVVLMLGLPACSQSTATGGILKIATDLPVSGNDAFSAKPAEDGVTLAVLQNQQLGNGYTLEVVHKNDEAADNSGPSADVGRANIQALINDPQVIAGVGPFNSGVAVEEIPLINQAGLAFISPSNTNPGLTKEQYANANGINFANLHPSGKPEAYFRLPGTDDVQGSVLAHLAKLPRSLGGPDAQHIFVVDDGTTYGKGLANYFSSAFQTLGGTILARVTITSQTLNGMLPTLVSQIISMHTDGVFYGGESAQGGPNLKLALYQAGDRNLMMLGGDGIADDPAWIQMSSPVAAANTVATIPAPDVSALDSTSAAELADSYKQVFPNDDYSPYSVLGYDSAMVEITAIRQLIKSGQPVTRSSVRSAVAHLVYDGITGLIQFDANGDNTGPKIFSVYVVDISKGWQVVRQYAG